MAAGPNGGVSDFFVHGMGLISHEAPFLMRNRMYDPVDADRPLEAGMVLSVETTMQHPRRGYIKLEDTVAVTADGYEMFGERGRGWNRGGTARWVSGVGVGSRANTGVTVDTDLFARRDGSDHVACRSGLRRPSGARARNGTRGRACSAARVGPLPLRATGFGRGGSPGLDGARPSGAGLGGPRRNASRRG